MELKNKMNMDRSGISTILIAVIVIVVIAVAAAAAYVFLTGNDEGDKEVIAPGTVLEYDQLVNGEYNATLKAEYKGQNADEYFVKISYGNVYEYGMEPKGMPDGAKKTGTAQLDTILGNKTVDVWEYTEDGIAVKAYADQSNPVLAYKQEWTQSGYSVELVLSSFEPVWQTSYEESEDIGTEYTYIISYGGYSYDRKMVCIADCLDGKYGVSYDVSNFRDGIEVQYYLSNYPEGLPSDAIKVGNMTTIVLLNGENQQVEKWTMSVPGKITSSFYCDPVTHIVYRAVFDETGAPIVFDLQVD